MAEELEPGAAAEAERLLFRTERHRVPRSSGYRRRWTRLRSPIYSSEDWRRPVIGSQEEIDVVAGELESLDAPVVSTPA